ncbi:MAG: S41 family peptidase [Alphaproteobacteria bacterium]|nr:S41 family peptidase [Alphaproteobacteria bacterium]
MRIRDGLMALGVLGGLLLIAPPTGDAASNETYRQLNLFGDVFERVRADYVEEVTDSELIEAAINGMLSSLDPHSSYLNPENFEEMQVQTKGEFGGLGIEVTMENGVVKVVSPIDDTPAFRAGIEAGDFITHLDGEAVLGMTLSDAVDRMRGPVDTEITLTVVREGVDAPFDVVLKRDVIQIQSVRSRIEDTIGYVRVTQFSERTDSGIKEAIDKFKAELGDKLEGIVLDLRNNPGGLLDQAVAVSDAFLDQGEIVSTRGRRDDSVQRFNARAGDLAENLPIVVIINSGSASASEIVAGALQDHRRAIVLGTRSFGKGSVQTIIPLGGNGAMRLTTARYYTPSGRSIQAKGIDPDIVVEQARVELLDEGERHEADLRNVLTNDAEGEPTAEESGVANGDAALEDYQLARALDLLHGIALYRDRLAVN